MDTGEFVLLARDYPHYLTIKRKPKPHPEDSATFGETQTQRILRTRN